MDDYNQRLIERMICGESPENMDFTDIKNIVIPALRKKIEELVKTEKYIPDNKNYKCSNILERAKAICGNLDELTGYELNNAVRILREEIYLIRLAIQKFNPNSEEK